MSVADPPQELDETPAEWTGRLICLQIADPPTRLDAVGLDAAELSAWADDVLSEIASGRGGLTVRLVGDEEMRRLNHDFRGLDRPTDVLSFPGDATPEGDHLGDVVIATSIAERQASARGHGLATELRVLILHGALHCLGYDHETDDGEMETLEAELGRRWIGIPATKGVARQ